MKAWRSEAQRWAAEDFADADLGDSRRTTRLVRIVARAAEKPSGKLSEVFAVAKELDAAYDFVESRVAPERLEAVVAQATTKRCKQVARVRVAVDGSSLTLAHRRAGRTKGFGPIGRIKSGWFGLKVINALAVDEQGVPIGLLAQSWWARSEAPPRTPRQRKRDRTRKRPLEKETGRWLETIQRGAERLTAAGVDGWFQLDREADAWPLLHSLASTGHWFTVRSSWNRRLADVGDKQYLRAYMASIAQLGTYELDVPERWGRQPRRARMVIRAAKTTLLLREKNNGKKPRPLGLHVVWTHEVGTTPSGEKPLDWMLLTNAPVECLDQVRAVVEAYSTRWRIEEFHRTWKTGGCNAESTQLRSRDAVIRWATILAVTAARVERLKRLGREQPNRPATDELSSVEIEVLIALKRRYKKCTESVPDAIPTMAQAMRWVADLGGYTGQSSGGPPGAITLGRGLERLQAGVEAVLAFRNLQK
jgi:hypothetical protein